jgi:hypothetical protein
MEEYDSLGLGHTSFIEALDSRDLKYQKSALVS